VKDILKEYVPEVIVRNHEKKTYLFVYDKATQALFENEPFILIDGIPVFDTDRIVNLPAHQIKKLEVLTNKFFYGYFVFNGIVSFTSNGDFAGIQVNPEALIFDYEGLHRHQEFYAPQYNKASEERLPDFRNLLLWEPNLTTDLKGVTNVTFSTSDLVGKYIAVIEGLTADGLPGSLSFTINVR
jgi:hypothetical protein